MFFGDVDQSCLKGVFGKWLENFKIVVDLNNVKKRVVINIRLT
jgi:hypothetical protein